MASVISGKPCRSVTVCDASTTRARTHGIDTGAAEEAPPTHISNARPRALVGPGERFTSVARSSPSPAAISARARLENVSSDDAVSGRSSSAEAVAWHGDATRAMEFNLHREVDRTCQRTPDRQQKEKKKNSGVVPPLYVGVTLPFSRKGAVALRAGHPPFNDTTQPIISPLIGTLFFDTSMFYLFFSISDEFLPTQYACQSLILLRVDF